jgi:hypothetical protein
MWSEIKHIGIEKGKHYNPDTRQSNLSSGSNRCKLLHADAVSDRRARRTLPVGPLVAQCLLCRCQHGLQLGSRRDTRRRQPVHSSLVYRDLLSKQSNSTTAEHVSGATARDKDGNLLQGGETYLLTVLKDVPIDKFRSLTVYDMDTWAFIYTREQWSRSFISRHDEDETYFRRQRHPLHRPERAEGTREQRDSHSGQKARPAFHDVSLLRPRRGLLQAKPLN